MRRVLVVFACGFLVFAAIVAANHTVATADPCAGSAGTSTISATCPVSTATQVLPVYPTRDVPCKANCGAPCEPINGQQVQQYSTEELIAGTWWPTGYVWCPGLQPDAQPTTSQLLATVTKLLPAQQIGSGPPPDGLTLVNIQIILWLNGGSAMQSFGAATLVGHKVEFQGRIAYTDWAFGDGASEQSDAGGRVYDLTLNPCRTPICPGYFGHVYKKAGPTTITATPHWDAQFRVDGSAWQDLGTVAGPASSLGMTLHEARAVLVPSPR